ncbi:actin interacting protein 3-domain-containing protein [Schizophyllum commune]
MASSPADAHIEPAVESSVTRLLVSIKQLLEALTQWSQLRVDENAVSDVYVRLGNDFNTAVFAFASYRIDMAELLSVPDDLRGVLEQCLAEEANNENLQMYLPTVRQIIKNLLQGLREKQSIYRRIVSEHKHRSDASGHERTESRSSRGSRGHRSTSSRAVAEGAGSDAESVPRRSTHSSRRHQPTSSISSRPSNDHDFIGGFSPSLSTPESLPMQMPSPHAPSPRPEPIPEDTSEPEPPPPAQSPPPVQPAVPASVKRYSLVDKPTPPLPPPMIIQPDSPNEASSEKPSTPPPPETPPAIEQSPAIASSLAALKKSDTLERRASKRFSTYHITRMTGSGRGPPERGTPKRHASNRRSLAAGPALTPGDLAVLTEVDDEEGQTTPDASRAPSQNRFSRTSTPDAKPATPPVPPLPGTPAKTPEPVLPTVNGASEDKAPQRKSVPGAFTVFLQVGREVKKATIERGLSVSSLRMLFVDRFAYNPGQENFPAIYIRDPSSGVQYELEDMEEVTEKCLLSLNIEPLDQIKQHIDTQMGSLAQEIKELRSTVAANANRNSQHLPTIIAQPMAESTPRPSDKQFQSVARRLSRFVAPDGHSHSSDMSSFPSPAQRAIMPQMTGQSLQPQMTGMSEYTSRVVSDLKTQFDEVQNLRRDLGVMRQLYTEFMKQTKDTLGTLRSQTHSVKELASQNVGGARAYIDTGKTKLDGRSQNVLTEMDKLQDAVEAVKEDVVKRNALPKSMFWKNLNKDIEKLGAELEALKEHVNTVRPMWKKTWSEELANIVEEQQFLTHQEELIADLFDDFKAVGEMYGQVDQIISLRGSTRGPRKIGFKPPPMDEGHTGLSTVMLEIRGASFDPEKRLKAIEASQQKREKEMAGRTDELQAELQDFVGQKKLKMTGGAEEAERVRQKRNEQTLKAMFNGTGSSVMAGANEMGAVEP